MHFFVVNLNLISGYVTAYSGPALTQSSVSKALHRLTVTSKHFEPACTKGSARDVIGWLGLVFRL